MNKNTEQFQWTNELLKEWAEYYIIHEGDNLLEKFIQSKSKTEQPLWEILSYSNPNVFTDVLGGNIVDAKGSGANYAILKNFPIHSVKRLSDGEVFSVGDSLDWMGEIKSIEIDDKFNGGIAFINNSQKSCISTAKKAPKEEQVPIKVEIMEFGYGKPQENKGKFYVANFNLPNNAKLPTEKYQSIKSAIEDVLNEDKIKHEKLLSKIESKVRLANMINTQANYLKETLDYINSLK